MKLPDDYEMLGRVIKRLGGDKMLVKCTDGKTRMARIRGKLKRKVWVRDNDVVKISPWEFGNEDKADITWRFTLAQVDWLKDNGHIPQDL